MLQADDVLTSFPSFQNYNRNGLQLSIRYKRAQDLAADEQQWAYDLCKLNMEELYLPVWGWNAKSKQQQLHHEDARFLVAYQEQDGKLVPRAFLHFR